jgi:Flp pilus assembly protein TadD
MWGAALIHLRRAVVRNPTDLTYRLALAVAYINLARYELAQQEIDEIKALAPHSDEVRRLESRLSTLKVRHVSTAKP